MLLAALAYYPIYAGMDSIGDLTQKSEDTSRYSVENTITRNEKMQNIEKSVKIKTYTDGSRFRETTISTDGKAATSQEIIVSTAQLWQLILLVFVQVIFVTMAYGPIAAFLVELFPTRIRYTSMSLPYHIGNGVFGGLLPTVATLLVTETHNHLAGLLYPIAIALVCFFIGVVGIKGNMISKE
jgi:hypothetical protein